jgi:hypothetical protein
MVLLHFKGAFNIYLVLIMVCWFFFGSFFFDVMIFGEEGKQVGCT